MILKLKQILYVITACTMLSLSLLAGGHFDTTWGRNSHGFGKPFVNIGNDKPAAHANDIPDLKQFEGIEAYCPVCLEDFEVKDDPAEEKDYIVRCPQGCKNAYHHVCLSNAVNSNHDRPCPMCRGRINKIPDGILYEDIVRANITMPKHEEKPATATQPPLSATSDRAAATSQTPEAPKPPLVTPDLIAEGFAACIYGMLAQHILATPDLTKTQKAGQLGGLGLSLVVFQALLNKDISKQAYDTKKQLIAKKAGAWALGMGLGFLLSLSSKKLDENGWLRNRS